MILKTLGRYSAQTFQDHGERRRPKARQRGLAPRSGRLGQPPSQRSAPRLLYVLGTTTGGVGAHVRLLAEALAGEEWAVTVASPAAAEELFGLTSTGAAFTPVEIGTGPRPARDVGAVRALRAATRRADVVHAHGLRAGALAGLALGRRRRGRAPLVVTWHNAVLPLREDAPTTDRWPPGWRVPTAARQRALTALERLAARRADVTLGASADLVVRAGALGAVDARLAPVAAPPLPPPTREPAAVRAELGAANRPIVLAAGRLAPQKGYGVLLDAARDWAHRDPPPLVVIAGDGPEEQALRRRIADETLPVRLLGRRTDMADLLAAADVAVLTSTWEARPLVAQEALRAGVPLVATAVGGVPDLVGDAALLVPPGAGAAVARAVVQILDDPTLAADLGERGRRQAATWPGPDDTAAQLLAVYRELAAALIP